MPKLRFAMVCASNMNRSMEAHKVLKNAGFQVSSYGVGGHVKLPGKTQKEPNVYEFGTPYQYIYDELKAKDPKLYTRNGLLQMLERNLAVKTAPERWQENRDNFDVVVTFEERVLEQLLDDMNKRQQTTMKSVLVVNIDVKDNHEESLKAGQQTLRLCQMLEEVDDWEDEIDSILAAFEKETGRKPIYTICFY